MTQAPLRAVVAAGRGIARDQPRWQEPALAALLGGPPAPGTLNLLLDGPAEFAGPARLTLDAGRSFLWAGRLQGRPVLLYRWKACPLHVVEAVSREKLRDAMALADGQAVEVEPPALRALPVWRRLCWRLLWGARPAAYYEDDRYVARRGRLPLVFRASCQRRPERVRP